MEELDLLGPQSPPVRPTATSVRDEPSFPLGRRVADELRWNFSHPRILLEGIGLNLTFSLLYLLWDPLSSNGAHHRDWVALVGTYFATFILADVTTTNSLGLDAARVRTELGRGGSIARILIAKNVVLVAVVGVPTLLLTAVLTVVIQEPGRLAVTLPDVALPITAWLGVGNLVSVLLPVAAVPLIQRWRERRRLGVTFRWAVHLVLPYALYYVVAPVGAAPREILGPGVSRHLTPDARGAIHLAAGIAAWGAGTAAARFVARRRRVFL